VTTTVAAIERELRALGIDRLDAHVLLAHVLQRSRAWLIAHDDAALDGDQRSTLVALARRRADGEPMSHMVGGKEFRSLWLHVNGDVLAPRPDTELLVECALGSLDRRAGSARVLDLGTGSGAIALAIKSARPDALVHGSDASPAALEVARANATRLALRVEWRIGWWWEPWSSERFDVVVSNPPYVANGDPHLRALTHEPALALLGGPDGLDAVRAIVAGAGDHLVAGGHLWLEHGHDQASAVEALLVGAAFDEVETRRDLAGLPRVTGGRRPPLAA